MTEITLTSDVWTAVRRGDIFCSPRCGCGCTYAAFERAQREADGLAKLCGPGWRAVVWENSGWHYKVTMGVCTIHTSLHPANTIAGTWVVAGYTGWIDTCPQFISERRDTPKEAFREALDKMQAVFDHLAASVGDVRQLAKQMDAPSKGVGRPRERTPEERKAFRAELMRKKRAAQKAAKE